MPPPSKIAGPKCTARRRCVSMRSRGTAERHRRDDTSSARVGRRFVARLGLRRNRLSFVDGLDGRLVMRLFGLALFAAGDSVLSVRGGSIGVLLVRERPLLLLVRCGAPGGAG